MYIVEVVNKTDSKNNGPVFFTGHDKKHKKLADGMNAARKWIEKIEEPDNYEISYRIVGCL